ncbi:MAG: hypothetical protein ACP5PV_07010 [Methanothrix sp.]
MICRRLIGEALAVLVLLAADCCAILDGGLGLSADQLIDQSRGDYFPPLGMPASPQESRELWSQRSGIDFSQINSKQENNSSIISPESPAGVPPSLEVKPAPSSTMMSTAESLEGNWSLQLSDSKNRFMVLRLYATGDAIFGTGTINDGIKTQRISASGYLSGENVSLDAVTSGEVSLYRFNLEKDGNSMSGQYRAFPAEGEPWSGMVQAEREE